MGFALPKMQLFALDKELNLEPRLTFWQLLERIEPHVIGMNRLVGTYQEIMSIVSVPAMEPFTKT